VDYTKLDITPCNDHVCELREGCFRYSETTRETAIAWPEAVDRTVPCFLYWPMLRISADLPPDRRSRSR
jgi:hypothetical protein